MNESIGIVKDSLYYYLQRESSISNTNNVNDFSFYLEAFDIMKERMREGFNTEIEFRAINEFLYGLISIMIKGKSKRSELKKVVKNFNEEYPYWKQNKYLKYMSKSKKTFILIASKKMFLVNKILIKLQSLKTKMRVGRK